MAASHTAVSVQVGVRGECVQRAQNPGGPWAPLKQSRAYGWAAQVNSFLRGRAARSSDSQELGAGVHSRGRHAGRPDTHLPRAPAPGPEQSRAAARAPSLGPPPPEAAGARAALFVRRGGRRAGHARAGIPMGAGPGRVVGTGAGRPGRAVRAPGRAAAPQSRRRRR